MVTIRPSGPGLDRKSLPGGNVCSTLQTHQDRCKWPIRGGTKSRFDMAWLRTALFRKTCRFLNWCRKRLWPTVQVHGTASSREIYWSWFAHVALKLKGKRAKKKTEKTKLPFCLETNPYANGGTLVNVFFFFFSLFSAGTTENHDRCGQKLKMMKKKGFYMGNRVTDWDITSRTSRYFWAMWLSGFALRGHTSEWCDQRSARNDNFINSTGFVFFFAWKSKVELKCEGPLSVSEEKMCFEILFCL